MNKRNEEVIKEVNGYYIVKFYANEWEGVYGDISTSKEEIMEMYPDANILEGYGFICPSTGFCPDEAGDWYDSVEEAEEAILALPC